MADELHGFDERGTGRIVRAVRLVEAMRFPGARRSEYRRGGRIRGQNVQFVKCTSVTATDSLYPGTLQSIADTTGALSDSSTTVWLRLCNDERPTLNAKYICRQVGIKTADDLAIYEGQRDFVQVGAGIPSHTSPEGSHYWDSTNNKLYVNSDGATTWIEIATGAGSSHTLLDGSTHTDTAAQTVTKGSLIVGNTTPAWDELTVGTNGHLLTADSGEAKGVKWAAVPTNALLDGSTHSDSVAASVAKGSLVVGNATPKWDDLAVGTDGYFLVADAAQTLGVKWAPIQAQTAAGAPVHTAAEGTIYWDSTGDTLYVNDDGSTGWMAITSGGGAHTLLNGATHSDTASDSVTRGSLIYGNSTPAWDELVIGAAARVLRSDGTDAAWAQVVLTTDVTGALPVANGGTATTSYTKGDVLVASAATTLTKLAVGTNGQVLTADSGETTGTKWATPTTGTVTSVAFTAPDLMAVTGSPITSTGTLGLDWSGLTTGDLIYATAASTMSRRAIGTEGQLLAVSSGAPTWVTRTGSGGPSPEWIKYDFNYADFSDPGNNLTISGGSLPARSVVSYAVFKPSVSFSGGGITVVSIQVFLNGGSAVITGDAASAVSDSGFNLTTLEGPVQMGSDFSGIAITVNAQSTGGNLDDLTTGDFNLWLFVSQLPAP